MEEEYRSAGRIPGSGARSAPASAPGPRWTSTEAYPAPGPGTAARGTAPDGPSGLRQGPPGAACTEAASISPRPGCYSRRGRPAWPGTRTDPPGPAPPGGAGPPAVATGPRTGTASRPAWPGSPQWARPAAAAGGPAAGSPGPPGYSLDSRFSAGPDAPAPPVHSIGCWPGTARCAALRP